MGKMTHATLDGKERDIRELVSHGKAWSFNGVAGLPEAPFSDSAFNEVWDITLVNDTAWAHAIHLHGHHFEVVEAATGRVRRDTMVIHRGETKSIRLRANNPGRWLLHCHMLEHQAGGMVTWFNVRVDGL